MPLSYVFCVFFVFLGFFLWFFFVCVWGGGGGGGLYVCFLPQVSDCCHPGLFVFLFLSFCYTISPASKEKKFSSCKNIHMLLLATEFIVDVSMIFTCY